MAEAERHGTETETASGDETSDAVIAAARALAERQGIEAVNIARVADEAGLPRAQVMALFPRKEDILMSIVSGDLATLSRSLKDGELSQGGDTPETAVVVSLPESAAAAEPAAAPESATQSRPRLARRGELAQILELKSSDDAEAPRAPDAWLERRLRTFERSMSAIEARQADVEKNARAAAAIAEENIKALQATVQALQDRAEAAEAKAKTAGNELRAALNEATLRIQTVEGVAKAALAEAHPAVPAEAAVEVPVVAEQAPEAAPEPEHSADFEPAPDIAPKSFISEARRSMAAASAAAAIEAEKAKVEEVARKGRRGMTRYLLGGLGILIVFIAAAGMAFSKGVDDGRRDALAHITRVVAPVAVKGSTTPLDRLTARAQTGDVSAELQVALRYRERKDVAAEFHWMSLAAIHGHPVGQYLLAAMYAAGNGTAADPARALQWYEAAALQGNRKAMHALAVAYAQGEGTSASPAEAARWFSRAAGYGYVDSQFNLAVLYERGMGVPQSLLDAYKWYAVAARQGDPEARSRLDALKTQLAADDLAAATQAASTFKPAPFDVAANDVP
jgi:localization factor PodJL